MVELEDFSSKTGEPIFFRYDRFYETRPLDLSADGIKDDAKAQSKHSLASTNVPIKKLDFAYFFHAGTEKKDLGAQDLIAIQAMRYVYCTPECILL